MASVEQRELTESTFPSKEELGKLKKDELIKLIEDIEFQVKKEERQKEWGQQFDIWLIRAARKERAIEFVFSVGIEFGMIPGTMALYRNLIGIPKRVDKYEIQIGLPNGDEVWVNKAFIVACKTHVAESDLV